MFLIPYLWYLEGLAPYGKTQIIEGFRLEVYVYAIADIANF